MNTHPETYPEWEAFKRYRAETPRPEKAPWVAVVGERVVGCFATKDLAVDRLGEVRPDFDQCAVFHWDEQPAELALCLVFGR